MKATLRALDWESGNLMTPDLEMILVWRNQPRIVKSTYTQRMNHELISPETHLNWYSTRGPWWRWFVVQADGKDVGLVSFGQLDSWWPEFGYMLGEAEYEGKGIMTEALKLAFAWLAKHGYTMVRTVVNNDNQISRHIMHKLGFFYLCAGRPREGVFTKKLNEEWSATEYTSGRKEFMPI